MLGRSIGAGLLAVLSVFVFFGHSSHPKVATAGPNALRLAELRTPVKAKLPRRFPQTTHDVFFGIKRPNRWKSIVFHHSATTSGSATAFDRYHRQKLGDPDGIKYHFVIGNGSATPDGCIEVTNRWRRQIDAAHLHRPGDAPDSIAICLVGNFENAAPNPAQLQTAVRLAYVLMRRFDIPADQVRTHREVEPGRTLCPGKLFPANAVRRTLGTLASPEIAR